MALTVRLLFPQGGLRRWHENLHDALAQRGVEVSVDWRPAPPRPDAVTLLEEIERLLFARGGESLLDLSPDPDRLRRSSAPTDFAFDLTGWPRPAQGAIFPTYCGAAGDDACDHMLLSGATPSLSLVKVVGDAVVVVEQGRPALEQPHILRRGREAIAARLATLVRKAVLRNSEETEGSAPEIAHAVGPALVASFLAESLAAKARSRLTRLLAHEGHWRVGWRRLAGPNDATAARLDWPSADWTWLDDDRRRYYADPFLFEHDGVTHVFCEEYPYATGKGILSWFPLAADGKPARAPRAILERPHHLSYPLVFRHAEQVWMMPETCGGRSLELYRADPFPDKWTLDRVLLQDVKLADATLFEHAGRSWLTATEPDGGLSDWDCLAIFVAASPLGPWSRCGGEPVLIDASAARPAGHVFTRDGALWRPAQDCTRGYGSGLALCRIERLDEEGFAQSVERRLGPPPGARASGVHTLNTGGGFEAIDVVGLRSKPILPAKR